MYSSFRFEPPETPPDALPRRRLVHALLGRWRHRVTVVVGGPGLGKTTLLAQALAENLQTPQGRDVWIGIDAHDTDEALLAQAVATALAPKDNGADADLVDLSPTAVADAIWQRAPEEVCLVFDDVHLLAKGSAGSRWLAELLRALPANAHLMLTSRTTPPVPLARLRSQGAVLDLTADDLLFTHEELAALAIGRGVEPGRLGGTGGWPALAALAAHVGRAEVGAYLWTEVLQPLDPERRRLLAVLCDLGGGDDELLSAALDRKVDLAAELECLPLVAGGRGGWFAPHALWQSAQELALPPDEQEAVRRRAIAHLRDRGSFDEAFALVSQTRLWDLAPSLLRAACLTSDRLTSNRLGRWLAMCPEEVRATPAGCLATSLHCAYTTPADAMGPLRTAAALCREAGDVDGEVLAIAHVGRLAWWHQDVDALGPKLASRMAGLAVKGHPLAIALTTFGAAMIADLQGDDDMVLMLLATIPPGVLDRAWSAMAGWLEGVTRLDVGEADAACAIAERFPPTDDPVLHSTLAALRCRAWWAQGRVDEVMEAAPPAVAIARRSGVAYNLYVGLTEASIVYSYTGDVRSATELMEEAKTVAPPGPAHPPPVRLAVATASLRLAEGDEAEATKLLRTAMESHGFDTGADRRVWRQTLPLSYVLVPESRDHWDAATLRGHLRVSRDLAAAVVAGREARPSDRLRLASVELPDTSLLRAMLHYRLAAELAAVLHDAGRSEGAALLDALGTVGRAAVNTLATPRQTGKPARALLAALPAPPPRTTYVAALGPLEIYRDSRHGEPVTDPRLRRQRVHQLLAYLVGHRSTTRTAIMAALWPDLDPQESSNNLAVTLNYLLRVLEPRRAAGEPSYLLRLDGQGVRLVVDQHLRLDLDEFQRQLDEAAAAEADGAPSLALGHHLAAAALYRGALWADLPETSWMALDREHYANCFVATGARAAELLLGRGDIDQAEELARRAVDVDPWAETAHAVLVGVALARGHQADARSRLQRCLGALAEVDVEPSAATLMLQHRVTQAVDVTQAADDRSATDRAEEQLTAPHRVRRPDRRGTVT